MREPSPLAGPMQPRALVDTYLAARLQPSTLAAYRHHIRAFEAWCARRDVPAVPAAADTLARYLDAAGATWRLPTLRLALSAIQHLHRQRSCALDPTVARGLRSALARLVREPSPPPAALDRAALMSLLDALPPTLLGKRNRAMLLLGFAAALRPGEIVGLDLVSPAPGGTGLVRVTPAGIEIFLRRSKTDPQQRGLQKLIPFGCTPCPVTALEDWLAAARITTGVLFPSSRGLCSRLTRRDLGEVVRRAATIAALDPGASLSGADRCGTYSGRSLRSGFVTSATRAQVPVAALTAHVGWASPKMAVLYSRALAGERELVGQILEWHRSRTL